MGKRGPKSRFTDVACPNKDCEEHGVAGHGNIIGNGTYQARNTTVRRYICHSCGKAFCDSTNTFYYNLRKDESTIDLALNISMKGMSNESTVEVYEDNGSWMCLAFAPDSRLIVAFTIGPRKQYIADELVNLTDDCLSENKPVFVTDGLDSVSY